mgnify:CR=1 FL=1
MTVRASDAPIAAWSIRNQLLALAAGTTDARGFKQWQDVGRHVKRGARAIHILGPSTVKVENENGETETRVTGFRAVPVFRVQDTEGEPLPDVEPVALPPLQDVAARLGLTVTYVPSHERMPWRGFYSPGESAVVLATHDERTYFHELAHAAHDVACGGGGTFKGLASDALEVVAETVAATLCRMYGYDGWQAVSSEYVARHTADGNGVRAALALLDHVDATLRIIFP